METKLLKLRYLDAVSVSDTTGRIEAVLVTNICTSGSIDRQPLNFGGTFSWQYRSQYMIHLQNFVSLYLIINAYNW